MGEDDGADAGARRVASRYGVTLYTSFVSRSNPTSSGIGKIDNDPSSIDPLYCPGAPVTPG